MEQLEFHQSDLGHYTSPKKAPRTKILMLFCYTLDIKLFEFENIAS